MLSGDVEVEQATVPSGQFKVVGSGRVTFIKSKPPYLPQRYVPKVLT